MSEHRLRFVSYDGRFPNLCSGTLIMELDSERINFPSYCLQSGGIVSFDDDWHEIVTTGPWTIIEFPKDFPEELKQLAEDLVNENVEWGCCGGCV